MTSIIEWQLILLVPLENLKNVNEIVDKTNFREFSKINFFLNWLYQRLLKFKHCIGIKHFDEKMSQLSSRKIRISIS